MNVLAKSLEFILQDHVHGKQVRKVRGGPFSAHPMSVSALVLQYTGREDVAAAAMLHDVLEDTDVTYAELVKVFGTDIAGWVLECTEPGTEDSDHKRPWRERKEAYLDQLHHATDEARDIMKSDKEDNGSDILLDLIEYGPSVWNNFNAPREDQIWWYTSLKEEFARTPDDLQKRFNVTVDEILKYA